MWVSRREIARLERELSSALHRAKTAEENLAEERKRLDDIVASERGAKDFLTLQLTSRVITKHGGYGLAETKPEPVVAHPKGFVREPEEVDTARFHYYVRCYQEAGKSPDEAQQLATNLWEAEMRGESVTYEYEQEQ